MTISIPQRSMKSKYAKSYLFLNDVYIFIEDTDKNTIKILLELIQRSISHDITIDRLHPLGGREAVLEKFQQRNTKRKEIYIIDGDLYLLFDTPNIQKGLIVLERYCIENYLLDFDAIQNLVYEECSNCMDKKQMIKEFSLTKWFKSQDKLLSKLFVEYAVEKKHRLGIQTVKYKVEQLQKRDGKQLKCELCKILVNQRAQSLRKEVKQKISNPIYLQDKKNISNNFEPNQFNSIKYVSAKDYIFPLIFKKIKKFANSNVNDSNFKYRISTKCNTDKFETILKLHLT